MEDCRAREKKGCRRSDGVKEWKQFNKWREWRELWQNKAKSSCKDTCVLECWSWVLEIFYAYAQSHFFGRWFDKCKKTVRARAAAGCCAPAPRPGQLRQKSNNNIGNDNCKNDKKAYVSNETESKMIWKKKSRKWEVFFCWCSKIENSDVRLIPLALREFWQKS